MKITNIFTLIEEFRNGRDIWTHNHVELAVREIRRLDKENQKLQLRLAASENDILLCEVNEILKKTQSRVQELEAEQRWIPVSERLPEESGYYLIAWQTTWGEGELFTIQQYYKKEDDHGFGRVNVKYWRPLPQPPKDGE